MSESEVKLLNSPYGEVTYESFRKLKRAFADKSAMIKSLDDNGMTLYPVLLISSSSASETVWQEYLYPDAEMLLRHIIC